MATSDPQVATPIALPLLFFFLYSPLTHTIPLLPLRSPSLFISQCAKGKRSSQSDWTMSQTTTKTSHGEKTAPRSMASTHTHTQRNYNIKTSPPNPRCTSATTSVAQNGGHFELPLSAAPRRSALPKMVVRLSRTPQHTAGGRNSSGVKRLWSG